MQTAVATIPDNPVGDALSASAILAQVTLIQHVMKEVMIKDVHYGVIPGTPKPSLYKPGAEKLNLTFRLDPQYDSTERFVGDHLFIKSKCTLYHITTGRRMGSGEGSCSTKESKYAYRKGQRLCPKCGKEAIIKGKAEYGGGWLCFDKKGGCKAKWPDGAKEIEDQNTDRIPNEDLADQYNTILKMANKRSLVAAVLNVTAASDIFTQDVEDMPESNKELKPGEIKIHEDGTATQRTMKKDVPASVLEPTTAEALSEMAAQAPAQDNLFDQSSAQAEHEVALNECHNTEELQKAWDECVRDKRLTSESRPKLYELMKRTEKGFRSKK